MAKRTYPLDFKVNERNRKVFLDKQRVYVHFQNYEERGIEQTISNRILIHDESETAKNENYLETKTENYRGLEQLSDDDLLYLLKFIPWKSKKNLRCVSKLLLKRLTELIQGFQILKVNLFHRRNHFIGYEYIRRSCLDVSLSFPDEMKTYSRQLWGSDDDDSARESDEEEMIKLDEEALYQAIRIFPDKIVRMYGSCAFFRVVRILLPNLCNLRTISLRGGDETKYRPNANILSALIKQNCNGLQHLFLNGVIWNRDVETCLSNLKTLSLNRCSGRFGLLSLLSDCGDSLEKLFLNHVDISDQLSADMKALSTLKLDHCNGILVRSVLDKSSPTLKELTVKDIEESGQLSTDMIALKVLHVAGCSGSLITSVLKKSKQLQKVTIHDSDIFYKGMSSDLEKLTWMELRKCPFIFLPAKLQYLKLCDISEDIKIDKTSTTSLNKVEFKTCSITVMTSVLNITGLSPQEVTVEVSNIIDQGKPYESLKQLPSVRKIAYVSVMSRENIFINQLIRSCSNLKELSLLNGRLDTSTLESFRSCNTRLEILNLNNTEYYGEFIIELLTDQLYTLDELHIRGRGYLPYFYPLRLESEITYSKLSKLVLTNCNDICFDIIRMVSNSLTELEIQTWELQFSGIDFSLPLLKKLTLQDHIEDIFYERKFLNRSKVCKILEACSSSLVFLRIDFPVYYSKEMKKMKHLEKIEHPDDIFERKWCLPKLKKMFVYPTQSQEWVKEMRRRISSDAIIKFYDIKLAKHVYRTMDEI